MWWCRLPQKVLIWQRSVSKISKSIKICTNFWQKSLKILTKSENPGKWNPTFKLMTSFLHSQRKTHEGVFRSYTKKTSSRSFCEKICREMSQKRLSGKFEEIRKNLSYPRKSACLHTHEAEYNVVRNFLLQPPCSGVSRYSFIGLLVCEWKQVDVATCDEK